MSPVKTPVEKKIATSSSRSSNGMSVSTYTKAGAKATTPAKLDKAIFGVAVETHDTVKFVYDAYLANGRKNLAVTKTRGLVRGGGKKPWKQKGTGRARVGSTRSPIWRSGGVTFGPTGQENYSKAVPLKLKRQALKQALSLAASANKITVIEAFAPKDGKSGAAVALLDKIGATGRTMIVVTSLDEQTERAVNNLPDVSITRATQLHVFGVMNADTIVITKDSLADISAWLGGAA